MTISALKLLALIIMFFDHIGEFIPNSPMWLRYIGRISAPLFFYCSAWGFYYTHNRLIYLLRLYVLGIVMCFVNILISHFVCGDKLMSNNIFSTIFMGCIIVAVIESTKHDSGKRVVYVIAFFLGQIVSFFLCFLFAEFLSVPRPIDTYMLYYLYGSMFGNVIFTEGSILFIIYFVIIYFLKSNSMILIVFHTFYSFMIGYLVRRTYYARGALSYLVPFNTFQWLMLLAIPFFLLYNGERGKGNKAFFYIFYPLHVWALFIIGYFM